MRILVVCGAGASSTFVAQRLRRAAESAGLRWHAAAGAETSLVGSDADLILLGPHLATREDDIAARTGARVAVLPSDVFDDRDGSRTLAWVRELTSLKGTS